MNREPSLSVLIPTRDRHGALARLLADLEHQTLPREAFQVVVVDDGSVEPVELPATDLDVTVLRGAGRGPAGARNLGLGRCRGPLTLLLNDDARLAPVTLQRHLEAHAERAGPVAVLGSFDFVEELLGDRFIALLQSSNLLFDFVSMEAGRTYGWRHFWTCNLSLPTSLLREHSFDAERFDAAIVEDTELGFRLDAAGLRVLYRPDASAWHDHALTVRGYFDRMVSLGVYLHRMYRKHPTPGILWQGPDFQLDERALINLQVRVEVAAPFVRDAIERLDAWAHWRSPDIERPVDRFRRVGIECFHAGILRDAVGSEPLRRGSLPVDRTDPFGVMVLDRNGAGDPGASAALSEALVCDGWRASATPDPAGWREHDLVLVSAAGNPMPPEGLDRALYHARVDRRVAAVPLVPAAGAPDGTPWPFEYRVIARSRAVVVRSAAVAQAPQLLGALLAGDPDASATLEAAGWRLRRSPVPGPRVRGRWAPWSGEGLVRTLASRGALSALETWAGWLEEGVV